MHTMQMLKIHVYACNDVYVYVCIYMYIRIYNTYLHTNVRM